MDDKTCNAKYYNLADRGGHAFRPGQGFRGHSETPGRRTHHRPVTALLLFEVTAEDRKQHRDGDRTGGERQPDLAARRDDGHEDQDKITG